jgi:hypothetical protein
MRRPTNASVPRRGLVQKDVLECCVHDLQAVADVVEDQRWVDRHLDLSPAEHAGFRCVAARGVRLARVGEHTPLVA